MRPRCAIDQNAFRFPGARPNMADAWIRNSDWEDDNDLNNDLSKFVSLNLKIMEILDFVRKDYPNNCLIMIWLVQRSGSL